MKTFLTGVLLAGAAFADAVTDWNIVLLTTIGAESPPAQARPQETVEVSITCSQPRFERRSSCCKALRP